jgi:hypothetical protein
MLLPFVWIALGGTDHQKADTSALRMDTPRAPQSSSIVALFRHQFALRTALIWSIAFLAFLVTYQFLSVDQSAVLLLIAGVGAGTTSACVGQATLAVMAYSCVKTLRNGGETPFLHVFSDNISAIQLYERLGFQLRRTFHRNHIGHADPDSAAVL